MYSRLGEFTLARKLQEQVLEARGRLLGKEHPETLRAMNNWPDAESARPGVERKVVIGVESLPACRAQHESWFFRLQCCPGVHR